MHYHLEVVMPPMNNEELKLAMDEVMRPFNECNEDEDSSSIKWWDFYVIGGRWAGYKLGAGLDQEQMSAFHKALREKEVTVNSLQTGKQELNPASQIAMVDALWREYFPDGGDVCPLFNHYNNKYDDSTGYPDIMPLKGVPENLTAARVIFVGKSYDGKTWEAKFMLMDDVWNGCNFVKTEWDGRFDTALKMHRENLERYKDEYRAKNTPTDEWLVVTVDYHS